MKKSKQRYIIWLFIFFLCLLLQTRLRKQTRQSDKANTLASFKKSSDMNVYFARRCSLEMWFTFSRKMTFSSQFRQETIFPLFSQQFNMTYLLLLYILAPTPEWSMVNYARFTDVGSAVRVSLVWKSFSPQLMNALFRTESFQPWFAVIETQYIL